MEKAALEHEDKDKHDADDARVRVRLGIREALERQLQPLGQPAIDGLRLRTGDRVLDIGCGLGGTPAALAQAVGSQGAVVAIDVLASAVEIMRSDANRPPAVSFVHGDAEVYPFPPARFDAAFSRFGVMFFADPVAAFVNIRRALRPGGRLSFVCWRSLAENELDWFPIRAASPHLPPQLVLDAERARHFSFADPMFVRETLTRAGFDQIDIRQYDQDVRSGDFQSMLDVCCRVGSLGALLREHPQFRDDAVSALKRALAALDGPGGPVLRASTWIVGACATAAYGG